MFKNVVHSLEPGETPSNSASYKAPNYVQHYLISQNTFKRCVAVAVLLRLFFQFTSTVGRRTGLLPLVLPFDNRPVLRDVKVSHFRQQ